MTDRVYKTTKSPFAADNDSEDKSDVEYFLDDRSENFTNLTKKTAKNDKKSKTKDVSKEETERIFILQPVTEENEKKAPALLSEAKALIEGAGAYVAGSASQKLRYVSPATIFGAGKLAEIAEFLTGLDVTILFNGELTPSQTQNISAALGGRKVIDRTALILDIFARNAKTSEGKLQVELAQLRYLYPRLKGKGAALSRLGGGVGTRGPGETRLETDRRYIRGRMEFLEKRLHELERRRTLQTARRKKTQMKTIALVGYTNAGKSTLFNLLCNETVYAANRLFATLDATSRKFTINDTDFLLTDTVGFLRDLPHHLIESFKSTLESALNCDLALIVCDGGDYEMQIQTTKTTLESMNFSSPVITVVNKSDLLTDEIKNCGFPADYVLVSAKTGEGIVRLKEKIYEKFSENRTECILFVPYLQMNTYAARKSYLAEHRVEYLDDGVKIRCAIPNERLSLFRQWIDGIATE